MARKRSRTRKVTVQRRAPASANSANPALVDELEQRGVTRAKVGGFDIDGVLRGKYVSLDKLRSALAKGFGFCDVIFGWDVADVLYDNATLTGWHTGYPDAHAVLDAATLREIPWEPGVVALLADFRDSSGKPHPACPRSLLKRVLERAEGLGYSVKVGVEFEFFFFRETRESLVEKHFQQLVPLDPGMFGYSWVRAGQDAELMRDVFCDLKAFDIELEGLHTETGPGVYEAAIRVDDALRAADKAALFKSALKQIAHRHGLSVTFMAKWNADLPGSSGHIHQSLWRDGNSAFADPKSSRGMSRVMEQFLAGQMTLMRELTAMVSPTINSYKRYVPGVWAPLSACWGIENRTASLRVIGAGGDSPRVEHRQGAADMNPYLAISATLGAGLWGIENQLKLGAETQGDAGEGGENALPRSLAHAAELLQRSKPAQRLFTPAFVDHYVKSRQWEVRCYERAVTDWELKRYFEVI